MPVDYFLKSIMEEPFCVRVTSAIFESRQVTPFSIIDVTSHTVNREPVESCINMSMLWSLLTVLKLHQNIRANPEYKQFTHDLLEMVLSA